MGKLSIWRSNASGRTVETDVRARQGPAGRPVLAVVIGSLALLGLYLIGMMVWSTSTAPTAPRENISAREVTPTVPAAPGTSGEAETDMEEVPPANPAYPAPAVPAVR
jgi:hypothetical protein